MNKTPFSLILTLFLFVCNIPLYCNKELGLSELKELVDVNDLLSINTFESRAKKYSNHLHLAYSYYCKTIYYRMSFVEDSFTYYAHQGLNELDIFSEQLNKSSEKEINLYRLIKVELANHIVQDYFTNNKYDLALIFIQQMLDEGNLGEHSMFEHEAYYLAGVCYLHLKKGVEALSNFQKAYNILMDSSEAKPFSYHRPLRGMSHAYLLLKDYDKVIKVNENIENMIDSDFSGQEDQCFLYYQSKYMVSNESALALVLKGDLFNARKKLNESDRIFREFLKDSPLKHAYYEVEAQYNSALGKHEKAKEYINLSLNSYYAKTVYNNTNNYLIGNLIRADILNASGDQSEAYALLRNLYQLNDSVTSTSFSLQLAELQMLYKVDKMELEAMKEKMKLKATQSILFVSILISIFLGVLVYVIFRNARVLRAKNKQLYNQFIELEGKDSRFRELEQLQSNELEEGGVEINSYSVLVDSLEEYLLSTQVYKNPDLTREELALAVATNRQYLIEAIKERTGKTFNEYIYGYRIKYALELMKSDKTRKISDVAIESGFQSRGTFNRIFKGTYGMNPSELRDILD